MAGGVKSAVAAAGEVGGEAEEEDLGVAPAATKVLPQAPLGAKKEAMPASLDAKNPPLTPVVKKDAESAPPEAKQPLMAGMKKGPPLGTKSTEEGGTEPPKQTGAPPAKPPKAGLIKLGGMRGRGLEVSEEGSEQ